MICYTVFNMLDLIDILNSGTELNDAQLEFAAGQLLDENEDIAIKTQFLKSLAKKGETPSEIAGFVKISLSMQLIQNSVQMTAKGQPLMFVALAATNLIFLIFQRLQFLYWPLEVRQL